MSPIPFATCPRCGESFPQYPGEMLCTPCQQAIRVKNCIVCSAEFDGIESTCLKCQVAIEAATQTQQVLLDAERKMAWDEFVAMTRPVDVDRKLASRWARPADQETDPTWII